MRQINFTVMTSERPQVLTKRYSLNSTGELESPKTSANMYVGKAERITVANAAQFADFLEGLYPNQALSYGVTGHEQIRVLSKAEYEKAGRPADAITRTKDAMQWPEGAGVLMLDYDPENGARPLTQA
ncbi:MAG TPA: hypothetical protein VFD09_10230, partial [Thiopseudomonas sp.]|nr:hypothetical protein [Thiopseudomonas sp.]